ncbi:MAG TPA: hypothetical protein VM844_04090 [Miltoncostaeaceae bacterium]|nr:hypothetical protein [Miltoncostaeaceae bacterium]
MADRRIALVLVPGVGEEGAGETAGAVMRGLTGAAMGYRGGTRGTLGVQVPPAGPRRGERYEAETRALTLQRGPDRHRVDLVEMRWADISQFPRGLVAFFLSLFGFALQLATVGLEALQGMLRRAGRGPRGLGQGWTIAVACSALAGVFAGGLWAAVGDRPTPESVLLGAAVGGAGVLAAAAVDSRDVAVLARTAADAASWLAAAVVVPVTLAAAIVTAAFVLMIDGWLGLPDWLIAVVAVGGGAWLMWRLGRGIADGGWTYGGGGWRRLLNPASWSLAIFAAAVAAGIWRLAESGSLRVATGDTLAGVSAFGLRGAWMLALAVLGLALLLLAAAFALERRRPAERRLDARGLVTGSLATALSPLLVALVGLILFSGLSSAAFSTAGDARWGTEAPDILCLARASSWTLGHDCGGPRVAWPETAAAISGLTETAERAGDAATTLRQRAIAPGAVDRAGAARAATDATALAELSQRRADDLEADAGMTPVDWARAHYTAVVAPVVNSGVLGGALLALALIAFAVRAIQVRRSRAAPGERQGRAIAWLERLIARPWVALTVLAAALVGAYWTWATYCGTGWRPELTIGGVDVLDGSPAIWAPGNGTLVLGGSAVLVLVTVLGRLFPVDPSKPLQNVGGRLETVRRYIDIPYDVATYLRIDHGDGVRTRIVARYRALLDELRQQGYDAVVLVAHSQGSALSAATLCGDRYRRDPEGATPWGDEFGVLPRPADDRPARLTGLMTFGCPVRQLYEARLPHEYEELWSTASEGERRRAALTLGWVNVYRARDYVGRSVFADPDDDATLVQGAVRPVATPAGGPELLDACLRGPRSHTGYWGDPEHTRWVDYMVRRALGEPAGAYPEGYA